MDRLTSIEVFVRSVEMGSFVAAASAMRMTPQMAGKHILSLEQRFKTRLLNRTTRQQSLTDAGRTFFKHCKAILAETEAADQELQTLLTVPSGALRIRAPTTFGSYRLTQLVAKYLRKFPEVSIEIVLSDKAIDLAEDGCDAEIRIGPLTHDGLVARRLEPFDLVICASPGYLEQFGTPLRPKDLLAHNCIAFVYANPPSSRPWHLSRDGSTMTLDVSGRLRVSSAKALHSAAMDGFGIVLGPTVAFAADLACGKLVRVLPDYKSPSMQMHLLYAPDRHPTPSRRAFIDFIVQELGELSPREEGRPPDAFDPSESDESSNPQLCARQLA
ncbi:LysR substrate-binding domain-containing protein [Caballeronia sp. LP003]|uniref:LysR substrate-binding domain-containing protein n=1 Tax=Caballeronia sp. LP003 TaxID=3038551 RepID=UPI00285EC85C|nr:LysR substrate-binding domain-containing protein [Caballeronia sp. LP003]MDR5785486.1 LysR substrate-binding domain-containing protein [Caballeronia sp. LP003]